MRLTPGLTNTLLAVAVLTAFVTGWVAFTAGTGWGSVIVVMHGVAGLSLLVLSRPKLGIVGRGWRRRRPGRAIETTLTVLAFLTVTSGIIQAGGWLPRIGPFNPMQIHVAAGVAVTVFTAWHFRRRPLHKAFDPTRRALMQTVGVTGLAGGLWLATESVLRLTGTARRFSGSHERSSFHPPGLPVTSWINDKAPTEELGGVTICDENGVRSVSVQELDDMGRSLDALLDCTSGWYSTQTWQAVPVSALVRPGVTFEIRSATGFRRRFPGRDADHVYLATRLGGEPLSPGHGAPVRVVAPGRRGFWWVKWVSEIVVDEIPWWRQFPFPLT